MINPWAKYANIVPHAFDYVDVQFKNVMIPRTNVHIKDVNWDEVDQYRKSEVEETPCFVPSAETRSMMVDSKTFEPVNLKPLDRDDRAFIVSSIMPAFTHGECYAFAEALHEGLGWPMYAIITWEKGKDLPKKIALHAFVGRTNDDGSMTYFDARGEHTFETIGKGFGYSPYSLPHIEEVESLPLRQGEKPETREHTRKQARRYAEALWPVLPWINPLADKVKEFAAELEALTAKYHLSVVGKLTIQHRPDDKNVRYEVQQLLTATSFELKEDFKKRLEDVI
jgi:hypothetical protein